MITVARLLQGAFGALMIPQGIALMARDFDRDMLRKAFSVFGQLLGIATVAGPILGGFLVDAADWRFMFLINIALGIGAFLAALHVLPSGQGDPPTVIDVLGIALGDVSAKEAGSAGGSLGAIQQLAAAIGPAVMTTVFFHTLGGSQAHAMTVSLFAVTAACIALVWLLPKAAQAEAQVAPRPPAP